MKLSATALRAHARTIPLIAATSCVAIATIATAPTSASAATAEATVSRGAGALIAHGTDYVGQYHVKSGGKTIDVYCINPTKREPGRLRLSTVTRVTSLSTTTSREMAEVLTAHGQTSSRVGAEATSQALNYLAGNRSAVSRRSHYIAKSTEKLAMAYVAEAQRLRGGYTVKIHLSAAALPGQSGTGTVTVDAAGGAKATTVTLAHGANVTTPTRVATNSRGTGTFHYTTTAGGEVHVTATAAGLAPTALRMSHPAAGYQRMVSAVAATSAHASASYQGRVSGFSNSYACGSQCNGHPAVTLRACASASADASHLIYTWPGGTKIVDFAASTKTTCTSTTVVLADGVRVTGSWQYHTSKGWTARAAAAGTFAVDCPAAPPVAVAMSYSCTAASLSVELGQQTNGSLTAERNTSKHVMVLVVTGAETGRYTLAPGATATAHTWPITCGHHANVTVQAGVQRTSGGWNYGQPASIALP